MCQFLKIGTPQRNQWVCPGQLPWKLVLRSKPPRVSLKNSRKSPGETTVEPENSYGTNTKHEKIVEILFDFFL